MRMRGVARLILAALLMLTLGGCTRDTQEFVVRNELDVPILTVLGENSDAQTGFRPEEFEDVGIGPGEWEKVGLGLEEPGFPWNVWPFTRWAETPCRDDLYLIVESQDGRRFVHDPPLCIDGDWTISI